MVSPHYSALSHQSCLFAVTEDAHLSLLLFAHTACTATLPVRPVLRNQAPSPSDGHLGTGRPSTAAVAFGVLVHWRLYPVIHALPLLLTLRSDRPTWLGLPVSMRQVLC